MFRANNFIHYIVDFNLDCGNTLQIYLQKGLKIHRVRHDLSPCLFACSKQTMSWFGTSSTTWISIWILATHCNFIYKRNLKYTGCVTIYRPVCFHVSSKQSHDFEQPVHRGFQFELWQLIGNLFTKEILNIQGASRFITPFGFTFKKTTSWFWISSTSWISIWIVATHCKYICKRDLKHTGCVTIYHAVPRKQSHDLEHPVHRGFQSELWQNIANLFHVS